MKNDNAANATSISINCTSNNYTLISDYKNHPAYVLFISSLKSNYTKIKYDNCLQKYLKHHCNRNIASLSDIIVKDPKVIESDEITQLIEMKRANFSYSTLSAHIACNILLFFYK